MPLPDWGRSPTAVLESLFMQYWSRQSPTSRPPLRYLIDGERSLLLIDLLELENISAAVEMFARIRHDRAFRRTLNIYVDCGYLRRTPTHDALRELARVYVAASQSELAALTGRRAIVAGGTWVYGTARLFAAMASTQRDRVRVFQSGPEALAWLCNSSLASAASERPDVSWASEARALSEIARRAGVPRW